MAIAINGDRSVVDHIMFGPPPIAFQNYLQQTTQYFQQALSDVGSQLVNQARETFNRMSSSEAMQIAKAALRMANTFFQHDIIYQMNSVSQLQEAPDSMVRWIMCHPTLHQYYQNNRIDGYGGRYTDTYPHLHGWDHPDYAYVYEGVVSSKVDEEGLEWIEFGQELEVETAYDVILSDEEKDDIIQAHELAEIAIREGRDPTSYYDSQIL